MLGSLFERRAIRDPQWSAWARGDDISMAASAAGVRVDEMSSMQLLAVYSCVRVISDAISSLPLDVFRKRAGHQEPIPNPMWVDQPNVDTDRISFMVQTVVSLLLRGNAFWMVTRNQVGNVVEIWNLHPDWVSVRRVSGEMSTKQFWIMGRPFEGEIVHIPALMFPGSIEGVDPITAAREAIGLGLATQEYGSRFFSQGAMPSGVIQAPGIVTPDQARELAQQWRQQHAGVGKSNLPAVLTGGASYQPIAISPEQAQFLQTRQYMDAQIYKLFGLTHPFTPTTGPNLTYANVEQLGTDVTRFTLMPWMTRIENAITKLLPRPQYAKFNADAFLRADLRTRYDSYKVGIETGFLEVNEARAWENLPAMDEPVAQDEPPAGEPQPRSVEVKIVHADGLPSGVEEVRA